MSQSPEPQDHLIEEAGAALAGVASKILEVLSCRIDDGLFPILTSEAVMRIVDEAGLVTDAGPQAVMKSLTTYLPDQFPGTGFNIEVTPLDIRVTRYGAPGPKPASVRKAALTAQGAETFLQGRANFASKLYFTMLLADHYMPLDMFSMILDQGDAPVWQVAYFCEVVIQTKTDLLGKARTTKPENGYVSIDFGEIVAGRKIGAGRKLVRDAQAIKASGFNHRLLRYLVEPHAEELSPDKIHDSQLMSALLVFVHDLSHGEMIDILPYDEWAPGKRTLAVLSSIVAARPDVDEADYTLGEMILTQSLKENY